MSIIIPVFVLLAAEDVVVGFRLVTVGSAVVGFVLVAVGGAVGELGNGHAIPATLKWYCKIWRV